MWGSGYAEGDGDAAHAGARACAWTLVCVPGRGRAGFWRGRSASRQAALAPIDRRHIGTRCRTRAGVARSRGGRLAHLRCTCCPSARFWRAGGGCGEWAKHTGLVPAGAEARVRTRCNGLVEVLKLEGVRSAEQTERQRRISIRRSGRGAGACAGLSTGADGGVWTGTHTHSRFLFLFLFHSTSHSRGGARRTACAGGGAGWCSAGRGGL